MKIDPKFVIKVAGTLTVIALVTAALLGLVDGVTRGPIAAIEAEKTRVAMSAVAPAGSEFTDKLEIPAEAVEAAAAQGGKVMELYGVKAGGCVMKISASGSQGTIVMMVGVNVDGAVTGISVINHSETSNIGTKITGNELLDSGIGVLDQFKGLTMPEGGLVVGGDVDAITGATVTTKGVTKGVNGALAAVAAMQA